MLRFVPTPIGNIGDISLRALEALSEADIFLCEDTRVTKKLLLILQERYNLSLKENQKFISLHSHNEQAFIATLTPEFFNQEIVYVSDAGMPCISDPGALLVQYAQKNSIAYDVLPGASALLVAYAASGVAQTQMLFYGFLPHKGKERASLLNDALYSGYATLLYESPHRIEKLLLEIEALEPDRKLFVAKELTKKFQKYLRGTAREILEKLEDDFRGEWVVILEATQKEQKSSSITKADILELDIPKKIQAKLLSKITGESIKECYNALSFDT